MLVSILHLLAHDFVIYIIRKIILYIQLSSILRVYLNVLSAYTNQLYKVPHFHVFCYNSPLALLDFFNNLF